MPGFGTTARTLESARAPRRRRGGRAARDRHPARLRAAHPGHRPRPRRTARAPPTRTSRRASARRSSWTSRTRRAGSWSAPATSRRSRSAGHLRRRPHRDVQRQRAACRRRWCAASSSGWPRTTRATAEREVLRAVLETPVSPELVPPGSDGAIAQKTEDLVGPYELARLLPLLPAALRGAGRARSCSSPSTRSPAATTRPTLRRWLRVFLRRFFAQQFKRSVMPDGPKVGSVSLSPRGDWRMPSDADAGRLAARARGRSARDPRRGRRGLRPRPRAGRDRPLPPQRRAPPRPPGRRTCARPRTRAGSTSWSWTPRLPGRGGDRGRPAAGPDHARHRDRGPRPLGVRLRPPGPARGRGERDPAACLPATTGTTASCGSSTCPCARPRASRWTWRSREGCASGVSLRRPGPEPQRPRAAARVPPARSRWARTCASPSRCRGPRGGPGDGHRGPARRPRAASAWSSPTSRGTGGSGSSATSSRAAPTYNPATRIRAGRPTGAPPPATARGNHENA